MINLNDLKINGDQPKIPDDQTCGRSARRSSRRRLRPRPFSGRQWKRKRRRRTRRKKAGPKASKQLCQRIASAAAMAFVHLEADKRDLEAIKPNASGLKLTMRLIIQPFGGCV